MNDELDKLERAAKALDAINPHLAEAVRDAARKLSRDEFAEQAMRDRQAAIGAV